MRIAFIVSGSIPGMHTKIFVFFLSRKNMRQADNLTRHIWPLWLAPLASLGRGFLRDSAVLENVFPKWPTPAPRLQAWLAFPSREISSGEALLPKTVGFAYPLVEKGIGWGVVSGFHEGKPLEGIWDKNQALQKKIYISVMRVRSDSCLML